MSDSAMEALDGTRVTAISMRGADYPVYVSASGLFSAVVEGHDLRSDTLRGLVTMAGRVPRRKVAVPFAVVHPGTGPGRVTSGRPGSVSKGVATGFHATETDSLLLDFAGQRKGMLSGPRVENAVQFGSPEQEAEIAALLRAEDEARQAVRDWIREHAFDLHAAVREALGEPEGS